MNVEKLKAAFEYFREDPYHNHHYLLECICNFLIELSSQKKEEPIQDEPYIPVIEFYNKTHLGNPSYINALATRDEEFRKKCARKNGTRWEVKLYAACKYISKLKRSSVATEAKKYLQENSHFVKPTAHTSKLLIT